MQTYVIWLNRYKRLIVLLGIFLVAAGAFTLKDIAFNQSYRIWFATDAPTLEAYDRFKSWYGDDDTVVAALTAGTTFEEREALERIAALKEALQSIEGIDAVDALTDIVDRERPDARMFNAAEGLFVDASRRHTLLVMHLSPQVRASVETDRSRPLLDAVRSVLDRGGMPYRLGGASVLYAGLIDVIVGDLLLFIPLVASIIALLLFAVFRRPGAVLIPLMLSGGTIILVEAAQILAGYELNNFTADTPVIIVAITVATSVHIYTLYIRALHRGETAVSAVTYALEKNIKPVLLTSLTTAIGFASLLSSDVAPIYTLGSVIALSVALITLLIFTLMPAMLLMIPSANRPVRRLDLNPGNRYGAFIVRNDRMILLLSAVLIVLLALGVSRAKVDNSLINYLSETTETSQSTRFIQEHLTGPLSYDVVVAHTPGTPMAERVEAFSVEVTAAFPEIRRVLSPQHQHYDKTRITLLVNANTSSRDLEIMGWIERWWDRHGLAASVYGQTALFTLMQHSVSDTLITSIAASTLLIFLVMAAVFRERHLIPLYLIPNILPLIVVVGVMGWSDIPIDFGVAISGAVILGIAIDDSMHFLVKYFEAREAGKPVEARFDHVFNLAGNAMIVSTAILSLTFLVLLSSDFMPNVSFAVVTSLALVIALLADLLLLPAILSRVDRGSEPPYSTGNG